MSIVADPKAPARAGSAWPLFRPAGLSIVAAVAAVYGAALAWTLLVRLPLWRMDGLDDAFYSEVAHLWTRGVIPYVGAYDVKPPGFFAILALAQTVFGPGLDALRAVAVVFDAATATSLYFLARRFGAPAVGLFAAALFPILSETVTSNDAYCPLAALTTLAFVAALAPMSLMKRAALSGLMIGAAGAVKQTAGFEAVALVLILIAAPEAAGRRARLLRVFAAAAAIAPLAFLGYFAGHGAARALIDDAALGALSRPASAAEGVTFLGGLERSLLAQKSVGAIFALAVLALSRRRALAKALPEAPIGALALWFGVATLSLVAQRGIAITYVGPTIAPGLILAGLGLTRAAPELARIPASIRLGALALGSVALALAFPGNDLSARQESGALAAAAAAIRASGPTSADRLYVVNRGAWLYSELEAPPPTLYFFPPHTLCDFRDRGPALLAEILAATPRYLVIADRRLHYVCEQPDRWALVDAALKRSYRQIAHAEGRADAYDVYEATGAPPSAF